jgi:hypothetical protein
MAFEFKAPTFPTTNTNPTDFKNPFDVVKDTIVGFTTKKGFEGQAEKKIIGRKGDNHAFIDSSFEGYLKNVGWSDGLAWCAFFVKVFLMQFYSFDRNWINKTLNGGAINNLLTIKALNNKGFKTWVAIDTDTPQAGDIAVWKYPKTGTGHTGIVLETYGDGTALVLEGNTTAKSTSREGDRVSKNKKKMKIGSGQYGQVLMGYYRRVFTPEEQSKLYFDETEQTLKFKA